MSPRGAFLRIWRTAFFFHLDTILSRCYTLIPIFKFPGKPRPSTWRNIPMLKMLTIRDIYTNKTMAISQSQLRDEHAFYQWCFCHIFFIKCWAANYKKTTYDYFTLLELVFPRKFLNVRLYPLSGSSRVLNMWLSFETTQHNRPTQQMFNALTFLGKSIFVFSDNSHSTWPWNSPPPIPHPFSWSKMQMRINWSHLIEYHKWLNTYCLCFKSSEHLKCSLANLRVMTNRWCWFVSLSLSACRAFSSSYLCIGAMITFSYIL